MEKASTKNSESVNIVTVEVSFFFPSIHRKELIIYELRYPQFLREFFYSDIMN
jgi:hypothetical protein